GAGAPCAWEAHATRLLGFDTSAAFVLTPSKRAAPARPRVLWSGPCSAVPIGADRSGQKLSLRGDCSRFSAELFGDVERAASVVFSSKLAERPRATHMRRRPSWLPCKNCVVCCERLRGVISADRHRREPDVAIERIRIHREPRTIRGF